MTDKKPMAAVLAGIMGEVGRIEKKGKITSKGDGPSYKFARDSDVLEAVTPKMAEAGIVLIPEHQELLSIEPSLSGRQLIANIKTGWIVTDGSETLRFETFGQGADSGDKALPKAQSNARKYAFFMLYHIVTGDDPDQHASDGESDGRTYAPRRATRPEAQPQSTPASAQYRRQELADVMAEKHLDNDSVLTYAAAIGIPADERPMSNASMDRLIEAIRTHGSSQELQMEQAADAPPAAAEPEAGSVSPAPAPSTVEEAIAKAEAKAKVPA